MKTFGYLLMGAFFGYLIGFGIGKKSKPIEQPIDYSQDITFVNSLLHDSEHVYVFKPYDVKIDGQTVYHAEIQYDAMNVWIIKFGNRIMITGQRSIS